MKVTERNISYRYDFSQLDMKLKEATTKLTKTFGFGNAILKSILVIELVFYLTIVLTKFN